MKITIEPTGRFQDVNGIRTRVWRGTTDEGGQLECYVALVMPKDARADATLSKALKEVKAERELVSFDLRLVV